MSANARKLVIGACIVLIVGLTGYYFLFLSSTQISEIKADPRKYEGKSVTVSGIVTNRFSLGVIDTYEVDDSSGKIMIVSRRTMPAVGTQVRVNGTVEEAFSLGSTQAIVILETNSE